MQSSPQNKWLYVSNILDLTEDILDYAEKYSAQRNETYRGCLPALYLKITLITKKPNKNLITILPTLKLIISDNKHSNIYCWNPMCKIIFLLFNWKYSKENISPQLRIFCWLKQRHLALILTMCGSNSACARPDSAPTEPVVLTFRSCRHKSNMMPLILTELKKGAKHYHMY